MSLNASLAGLERAQLVQRLYEPELAYLFRHTLVQETAYEALLHRHRREIHRQVARCYERLYAGSLEAHAAALAHHYAEAGDEPQATVRYAVMAGDAAFRQYANIEAIRHYTTALDLVLVGSGIPEPDGAVPLLIHLFTRRGRALELNGQYDAAVASYGEMAAVARQRGDRALELAALMAEATARSTPSTLQDLAQAQALSERALALAAEIEDEAAEARIFWTLSLASSFLGQPEASIRYGEQAVALARRLGLREQLAYALNDIQRAYSAVGDSARARAALSEAEALWRDLDNLPMLGDNLNAAAEIYMTMGDHARAQRAAEEAHRLSAAIGNRWGQAYNGMARGTILLEQGRYEEALVCLAEAVDLAEQVGFVQPQVFARMIAALVYLELGAAVRASCELEPAIAVARQQLPPVLPVLQAIRARQELAVGTVAAARAAARGGWTSTTLDGRSMLLWSVGAPLVWLTEAEVLLAEGQPQAALDLMEGFVVQADRFHLGYLRADVLLFIARARLALGQDAEGWAALEAARGLAEAKATRRILWRILAMMAGQAEARGESGVAAALRAQARHEIDYVAANAGTDDLRASFLALPEVHALLDEGQPVAAAGQVQPEVTKER